MTNKYFINLRSRTDGSYTIHRQKCPFLPEAGKRILLGDFESPPDAIKEGIKYKSRPVCCPFCLKDQNKPKIPAPIEKVAGVDVGISDLMKAVCSAMFCSVS